MSLTEAVGFIFGVAGIWLTIRESVWCFPVGLVNVIVSAILFFEQRLYSDVLQQLVYIFLLSYGWINWSRTKETRLEITRSSPVFLLSMLVSGIILAGMMGYLFGRYTNADVPYIDASATTLSFIAQFMIAKKKIENWVIWMVVNLAYTGIYIYKELYLYAFLFIIYFILAITGLITWKKELKYSKVAD